MKRQKLKVYSDSYFLKRKAKAGTAERFFIGGANRAPKVRDILRGTFEINSPEMPGNTSNFNNHHEVAYSFCLDFYIFKAFMQRNFTPTFFDLSVEIT